MGILTVLRHNPHSAEIYVMGVLPEHHHQGIGRRMVEHAEDSLAGRRRVPASQDAERRPSRRGLPEDTSLLPCLWFPPTSGVQRALGPRTTCLADGEGRCSLVYLGNRLKSSSWVIFVGWYVVVPGPLFSCVTHSTGTWVVGHQFDPTQAEACWALPALRMFTAAFVSALVSKPHA